MSTEGDMNVEIFDRRFHTSATEQIGLLGGLCLEAGFRLSGEAFEFEATKQLHLPGRVGAKKKLSDGARQWNRGAKFDHLAVPANDFGGGL